MRVVVVGAGLGGLAAAIAAGRAGHEVVVFERAPQLRESGSGIGLMPNGVLALDALGVGEEVRSKAVTMSGLAAIRDRHGRLLLGADQDVVTRQLGAPVVVVARRWLHRLLVETLAVQVRTGVEVLAVSEDGTVLTGDGRLDADLVVGADGVGSQIRAHLFPAHRGVEGVGELAARAVVRCPPELAAVPEPAPPEARAVLPAGELLDHRTGRRFGCMPMAGGDVYWYATWRAVDGSEPLAARFAGWHPAVPALIGAAGPEGFRVDELVRLAEPLPALTAGRVALLGDAAHAMTPDLGQGGCLAFEDAVQLGRELDGAERDDVAEALRRYDAARRRARRRCCARRTG